MDQNSDPPPGEPSLPDNLPRLSVNSVGGDFLLRRDALSIGKEPQLHQLHHDEDVEVLTVLAGDDATGADDGGPGPYDRQREPFPDVAIDYGNRADETSRLLGVEPAKAQEVRKRRSAVRGQAVRMRYFHQTGTGRVASICGLALVFVALTTLSVLDIVGAIGIHRPALSRLGLYQRPPVPAILLLGRYEPSQHAVCTAIVPSQVLLTASNFTIGFSDDYDDESSRREGPEGTVFRCDPRVKRRSYQSVNQTMWCCPTVDPNLPCNVSDVDYCMDGASLVYSFANDSVLTEVVRRPRNPHYFLLNWLAVGVLRIVLSPPSQCPLGLLCANCSWSAQSTYGDDSRKISGGYSRFGARQTGGCLMSNEPTGKRAIEGWCPVDILFREESGILSNGGFRPNEDRAKLLVRIQNDCPSSCFGKAVFVELHYVPKHMGSLFGGLLKRFIIGLSVWCVAVLLLLPQCVCQFARPGCSAGFILSLLSVIVVLFVLLLPVLPAIARLGGVLPLLLQQTGMICAGIFYWFVVLLTTVFRFAWKSAARKCWQLRSVFGLLLGTAIFLLWISWRSLLGANMLASPSQSTIALSAVLSLSWFVAAAVLCCFRLLRTRLFECPRDVSEVSLFCTLMVGIPLLVCYPLLFGADQSGLLRLGSQFSVIWTKLWVVFECFVVLILFLPFPELPCSHIALGERFLLQQGLGGSNFDIDHTKCYCRPCLRGKFPPVTLEPRGQPEIWRRRTFPSGWVRFGLHVSKNDKGAQKRVFQNWCCGYHGTSTQNVRSIVQSGTLLRAGDTTPGGDLIHVAPGHIDYRGVEDPAVRRALKNFVRSRFVTPSLKYASVYAPAAKMGKQSFQMVFEVRIQPDAINDKLPVTAPGGPKLFVEGQRHTLSEDFGPFEDPLFPTECLEWFTHREAVIVLSGLLVKVGEDAM